MNPTIIINFFFKPFYRCFDNDDDGKKPEDFDDLYPGLTLLFVGWQHMSATDTVVLGVGGNTCKFYCEH